MVQMRKKIILVDDNIINLTIGKRTLSDDYDVFTAPSGEKLFEILAGVTPDLILLDIEMPTSSGYDVIKRLKAHEQTKDIPVIFLTARDDTGSELAGLSLGAVDYISKPFSPPLLLKRIELHLLVKTQQRALKDYNDNLQEMVKSKTAAVVSLQSAILTTVAELVDSRDGTTGGHIERTKHYLRIMVDAMIEQGVYLDEVHNWQLDDFFFQSAQLHDVGKIAIRDEILMKSGKLTPAEFEEMKAHTTLGGQVIDKIGQSTSEIPFLRHAKIFALTHHERWDGRGYPQGLRGKDIPLQGRLMAIVDVYDALISERPYKEALPHVEAVATILSEEGHFDPRLVTVFASVSDAFERISQIRDSEITSLHRR